MKANFSSLKMLVLKFYSKRGKQCCIYRLHLHLSSVSSSHNYTDPSLSSKVQSLHSVHSWCCTFYGFRQEANIISCTRVSLHWKKNVCSLPFPNPWQLLTFLLSSWFCLFQNVILLGSYSTYVAFSDWLLSLTNMHLYLLHVFSWLDSSFPFRAE